jgi:hypothetical protein
LRIRELLSCGRKERSGGRFLPHPHRRIGKRLPVFRREHQRLNDLPKPRCMRLVVAGQSDAQERIAPQQPRRATLPNPDALPVLRRGMHERPHAALVRQSLDQRAEIAFLPGVEGEGDGGAGEGEEAGGLN